MDLHSGQKSDVLREIALAAGRLLLRVSFGGLIALGHGLPKWRMFAADPSGFPDPLGIGHWPSFYGAVGAELLCGLLLVLGLGTRLACLPLVFSMGVAVFTVHAADAWLLPAWPSREPALIYLLGFLAILLIGPGPVSLDALLSRPRRSRSEVPGT